MKKEFNDLGSCNPTKHYMVDTSKKIAQIVEFIERGKYFTINRPRQFGKTTTISHLWRKLLTLPEYLIIRLSFEGIGDAIFDSKEAFCQKFVSYIKDEIKFTHPDFSQYLEYEESKNSGFDYLSKIITNLVKAISKKIVLIVDEVDKSTDNQLFLHFLGMLRDKYLRANDSYDYTFHSVILAGVHDIKTLKLKISGDSSGKLNSPWNIAADFTIDMSFNPQEISTMLAEYSQAENVEMDIKALSERIYYYTSGYPYLVSKICKVVDENILI